jgi:hypothetical protein
MQPPPNRPCETEPKESELPPQPAAGLDLISLHAGAGTDRTARVAREERNWQTSPRCVSPSTPDAHDRCRNIEPADKTVSDGLARPSGRGLSVGSWFQRTMLPARQTGQVPTAKAAGIPPRRSSSAASPTACTPGAISSTPPRPRTVAGRPRFWAWAAHCTPFTSIPQAVSGLPPPRIQEWPLFPLL